MRFYKDRDWWITASVILLPLVLLLLAFQGNGINSNVFNVIPWPDRSVAGKIVWRDLQLPNHIGGITAPPAFDASNPLWFLMTKDYEGCLTSDGSLNLKLNTCVHTVSKNFDCAAASASGLHYTCSTENTFTPVAGDVVYFKADVANSASADLNVNGAGAKPIVNDITLVAIPATTFSAGSWTWCAYDGTNWQCILGASASTPLHAIVFGVDAGGAVVATGDIKQYPSVNYGCTINKAMISSDQSGSITIDIWKVNAAIPTSANKISASAPITLSSAQLNQASSISGWTTSVVANDVFGFNVVTVSTITKFTAEIWCQ